MKNYLPSSSVAQLMHGNYQQPSENVQEQSNRWSALCTGHSLGSTLYNYQPISSHKMPEGVNRI